MAGEILESSAIGLPFSVPDDWATPLLTDCCHFVRDGDWIETKDQGGNDYRLLQISNIGLGGFVETGNYRWITTATFERLRCTQIEPGDVLVARMPEPTGRCWFVSNLPWKAITAVDVAIIRAEPGVLDPHFLSFFLNSPQCLGVVRSLTTGTTRLRIRRADIERLRVPLPRMSEQRAIAHILGTLDDKVELNERMNRTLEATARALFKSWFADFDPVRAKSEGRDPHLPRHIADLFPESFMDSALGRIPKGWLVGVLSDALVELETGGRPKGGVSGYSSGVPSIGAESIVGLGIFDYSKTKYVPREYFDKMTKGRVRSRDVLLYKDGGRPGQFEPHATLFGDGFPFDSCAINEHVYRLRAKPGFGQTLLFFWLSSDLVMEEMRTKGTGVAIPGLNSTQVRSLTTLMPTLNVAQAFNTLLEPSIRRTLSNCNESRTLASLRDALLPKLISGELRMKDAERITSAAI